MSSTRLPRILLAASRTPLGNPTAYPLNAALHFGASICPSSLCLPLSRSTTRRTVGTTRRIMRTSRRKRRGGV
ncbi:uncharacterized protein MYCGRDRAFT_106592 [Zymoseptoria tritici IPO323]|uniref:Uncharacterized protein n=1 Tax=Zymoseptoria tritici (strain CBS 115943 / IPO323) TaxID=336722 RepID=F9XQT0_ZYMTI|nr:uncharacterized protein MYCGRDRAFT_106592 [Zymoseptoria tritici IPO323]EGP82432.1 hypothetical protein MYCGRDRAFT_106592 [Zymoseptoria tritici IPO323]